jgi:hypothetical protein
VAAHCVGVISQVSLAVSICIAGGNFQTPEVYHSKVVYVGNFMIPTKMVRFDRPLGRHTTLRSDQPLVRLEPR